MDDFYIFHFYPSHDYLGAQQHYWSLSNLSFHLMKIYNFDINNEFLKENNANIYNPPLYTREQILQEYEFCEQVFKLVFNDLAVTLNSFNGKIFFQGVGDNIRRLVKRFYKIFI